MQDTFGGDLLLICSDKRWEQQDLRCPACLLADLTAMAELPKGAWARQYGAGGDAI
jgi:hypothetical protein